LFKKKTGFVRRVDPREGTENAPLSGEAILERDEGDPKEEGRTGKRSGRTNEVVTILAGNFFWGGGDARWENPGVY